jgi:single-strand DNA-binding protein
MADITLTGNLGSDGELTFTPNGKAKLEFSVGDTPRRLNTQTNQWEDAGETTWWRVTEWGDKAEALADTLTKGTKVVILGTAGVRTYDKKDGTKGFSAEVRPKSISIVPRAGQQSRPARQSAPANDPWGAPAANAGWGTAPASTEPPF